MGTRASPAQLLGCTSSVRVGARALPRWGRLEPRGLAPYPGGSAAWERLQVAGALSSCQAFRLGAGGAASAWGVVVKYCARVLSYPRLSSHAELISSNPFQDQFHIGGWQKVGLSPPDWGHGSNWAQNRTVHGALPPFICAAQPVRMADEGRQG